MLVDSAAMLVVGNFVDVRSNIRNTGFARICYKILSPVSALSRISELLDIPSQQNLIAVRTSESATISSATQPENWRGGRKKGEDQAVAYRALQTHSS
jgi:hypothetical protein